MKELKEGRSYLILSIPLLFLCFKVIVDNMNKNEKKTEQDLEKSDDEEDLLRFLRGGFGAK